MEYALNGFEIANPKFLKTEQISNLACSFKPQIVRMKDIPAFEIIKLLLPPKKYNSELLINNFLERCNKEAADLESLLNNKKKCLIIKHHSLHPVATTVSEIINHDSTSKTLSVSSDENKIITAGIQSFVSNPDTYNQACLYLIRSQSAGENSYMLSELTGAKSAKHKPNDAIKAIISQRRS